MSVSWTAEQQKVIDLRNRNILVSAAAGSGKTAVLVERIINRIAKDENKTDIDRLLIVTFTNAAASEMRERIRDAIEKELEIHPEDVHLQKQFTLVHNAQITTIDSFCLYVIRNYFHKIDLEPNFRVGDEGEFSLLKSDVLDQVMEQFYEEHSEQFIRFMEGYGGTKNDKAIREMILKMYDYSQSYPWPEEWLDSCEHVYHLEKEELEQTEWMKVLKNSIQQTFSELLTHMEEALDICNETDGPQMYADTIKIDVEQLENICACEDYDALNNAVNNYVSNFPRLAAARKFEGSVESKDLVKNTRDQMKKVTKDIRDKFFYKESDKLVLDMQRTAPMAEMLVELTRAFLKAYSETKKEKNLVDFSDMEHLALQILVDSETKKPTETALEFAKLFDEIMIDEYQDSNYVQETILKAVSKEQLGEYDIFMVGDVKQSIYRFRLARPELFMDKFDHYDLSDSQEQRIDLHKNFRSREEVLEGVNDIFYKIMCRDLGNVSYDDEAALYPGADYYPKGENDDFAMEVLIAGTEAEEDDEAEDKQELEARLIASRIKKLLEEQMVTDKKTGELRLAEYKDIVILLRSVSGYADTFVKVLLSYGIPAYTPSKTGYFSTIEVQTVLNLLRIIDNPMQDIPLAAVLHSSIVGMSGEELAKIKVFDKEKSFYENVFLMVKEQENKKLFEFLKQIEKYRKMVPYTPVHELIVQVLEETGYLDYISALPAGEQKCANVQMLIERAIAYESTSYKGLFHFVRYIEKLQKYDVDYGEADIINENENAVKIMSIHKSKGLEFPIVFAAGMGKQFNMQDTRNRLILHPDLGIGMDYVDVERRTKTPTLLKKALARQSDAENRGEELRVLYVALTRAKEKLILTGCLKNPDEDLETYSTKTSNHALSFVDRSSANKYWDWILPALLSYNSKYEIQVVTAKDLMEEEIGEAVGNSLKKEQFLHLSQMANPKIYEEVKERLSYEYPYLKEKDIKTKVSVSELKHAAMKFDEDELTEVKWYAKDEKEPYTPSFIEEESVNQGALRGSAVHLVMQCIPFQQALLVIQKDDKKELSQWMEQELCKIKADERLVPEMRELVKAPMLVPFFQSDLARRMAKADEREELFREKAFVLGIPAKEIEDCDSEERVLVQGIIDAFFYEGEDIVVMDYKTDSVQRDDQLVNRYKEQLDLYARALEEATGKKVKEKIIYSFHLKKEIYL